MNITIIDIIIISLTIMGGITAYVNLYGRISRIDVRVRGIEREQIIARELTKDMFVKFSQLETSHVKISTLLEENLKHLIKIVDRHDMEIENLKNISRLK